MRRSTPITALPSTATSRSPAISPATALVAGSLDLAHVVTLYQRFGSASLHVDAQHGDVSLGGVSALATTKLTATGTPQAGNGIGSLGTAGAWADVHINAVTGDLTLGWSRACRRECDGRGPWRLAHRPSSSRCLRRSTTSPPATSPSMPRSRRPNAHNAFALALGEFSASGSAARHRRPCRHERAGSMPGPAPAAMSVPSPISWPMPMAGRSRSPTASR